MATTIHHRRGRNSANGKQSAKASVRAPGRSRSRPDRHLERQRGDEPRHGEPGGDFGRHPRRHPDGDHAVLAHRRRVHDRRRAHRRDDRPEAHTGHGAAPWPSLGEITAALSPAIFSFTWGGRVVTGLGVCLGHALGARPGRGALPGTAARHRVRHHRRRGRPFDALAPDPGHRHGLVGLPAHLRHHGGLLRCSVLCCARLIPRTPASGGHSALRRRRHRRGRPRHGTCAVRRGAPVGLGHR